MLTANRFVELNFKHFSWPGAQSEAEVFQQFEILPNKGLWKKKLR